MNIAGTAIETVVDELLGIVVKTIGLAATRARLDARYGAVEAEADALEEVKLAATGKSTTRVE